MNEIRKQCSEIRNLKICSFSTSFSKITLPTIFSEIHQVGLWQLASDCREKIFLKAGFNSVERDWKFILKKMLYQFWDGFYIL